MSVREGERVLRRLFGDGTCISEAMTGFPVCGVTVVTNGGRNQRLKWRKDSEWAGVVCFYVCAGVLHGWCRGCHLLLKEQTLVLMAVSDGLQGCCDVAVGWPLAVLFNYDRPGCNQTSGVEVDVHLCECGGVCVIGFFGIVWR